MAVNKLSDATHPKRPKRIPFQIPQTVRRVETNRLVPPVRGGRLWERKGLFDTTGESGQRRLSLIVAPAGYGKTTLISQWIAELQSQSIGVAYYAASERDADPAIFLAMLASALGGCGINAHSGAQPDGPEGLSIDEILLGLELADHQLVLFVDDFEKINDPSISALMRQFIAGAPRSVHVVIASRTFPDIPLSSLDISGELRLIDAHQLRLGKEELAWLLNLEPNGAEVDDVAACTQGWPVTVELYRLWRERRRVFDDQAKFGGHVDEVRNYLAEQLFSALPTENYELLIDIADQEEVNAKLVDAMRERQDSGVVLADIAKALPSLMRIITEDDGPTYKLHPLILDHLRQILTRDRLRRERLSRKATHWFLRHHRYPQAIRSAFASRDHLTIATVLESLRPIHIVVAGGVTALRLILREIPAEEIAANPRLGIMASLAHFKAGFYVEATGMLERIRESTRNFTIDPNGQNEWLAVEGYFTETIFRCQTRRCSPDTERVCARAMAAAKDDPLIWASGEHVVMLMQQIRGDLDASDAAIRRGRSILETIEPSRNAVTEIAAHQALVLLARGELRKLASFSRAYERDSGEEDSEFSSTPVMLRLILAAVRYEQEFSEGAVDLLRKSLMEHHPGALWSDQYAITYPCVAIRLYLQSGLAAVLAYLDDEMHMARRNGIEALPDLLAWLRVEYLARAGDVDHATPVAAGLDSQAADWRGWRELDAESVAKWRLEDAFGHSESALTIAEALVEAGHAGGRLRTELKGLILAALTHSSNGQTEKALGTLLEAVIKAYPMGYIAPFAEEGARIVPLIDALLVTPADAFARRHLTEIRRVSLRSMVNADDALNERENEIIGYLAQGLSNKHIARRMGVTAHTVKFHLKKIFAKLGVATRRAAVAKVHGMSAGQSEPSHVAE
jgi:LuxR family maltose regulon positive regulatory protein